MSKTFYGMCFLLCACTFSDSDRDLPIANLDGADEGEVNLSDLIDNARIIPLETGDEYLISWPQVWFADDFILVGSFQLGSQKNNRLFRFDLNGKFIDEIGAGTIGNGPGEHIGTPGNIRYYERDSLIQVNWGGKGREPQLFDLEGHFIKDIQVPRFQSTDMIGSFNYIERWNDSTWFGSSFGIVGPMSLLQGDSSLIHFFTEDGKLVNSIPRLNFSQVDRLSFPPAPPHYKSNNDWKFFVTGLDTLFRIESNRLIPEVVFQSKRFVNYNAITKQEEIVDKVLILSMTEGTNYWLLLREILDPVTLGGQGPNFDSPLILINKNSLQAVNLHLRDNVFNLFQVFFSNKTLNWTDGQKPFQGNYMYISIDANDLLMLLKNQLGDVDSRFQYEFDKLKSLSEDDNPVIFLFTLKDTININ